MRWRALRILNLASAVLLLGACPTAHVVDCLRDADCADGETCDTREGTCSAGPVADGGTCTATGICPYQGSCATCLTSASAVCLSVCTAERATLTTCSNSSSCASIMDLICTQQKCPTQTAGYNTCMNANCCEWKKCF